jgi:hypothetical protein
MTDKPYTYAVVKLSHHRPHYTVGRVVEIDTTQYVFPVQQGNSRLEVSFTNKELAFRYAKSLGIVLPGLQRHDFSRPDAFTFCSAEPTPF